VWKYSKKAHLEKMLKRRRHRDSHHHRPRERYVSRSSTKRRRTSQDWENFLLVHLPVELQWSLFDWLSLEDVLMLTRLCKGLRNYLILHGPWQHYYPQDDYFINSVFTRSSPMYGAPDWHNSYHAFQIWRVFNSGWRASSAGYWRASNYLFLDASHTLRIFRK